VLAGLVIFTVIRLRNDPRRNGRASRFSGSHLGAAWLVLGMIFLVIATLMVYRGAQMNTGVFPYPHGAAFASWVVGQALHPLGYGVNSVLEVVFILAQMGVILAFLVIVSYSKRLYIGLAPLNVLFSRRPDEGRRADWITELDFEVPVADGTIGPDIEYLILGRLRWRPGGPGQENHQGHRRTPVHRRGEIRGTRPHGGLHRRPSPPPKQRVRVLDARPAEHRHPQ
jgi:hypothetical protein